MKSSREVQGQQNAVEEPAAKRVKITSDLEVAPGPEVAPGLEITDQRGVRIVEHPNYEGDRLFVTVGSPIKWRVQPIPAGAPVANVTWTVTGETLARCTQSLQAGTAEPLLPQDLSAADVSFFWISGGVRTVRVTADVSGQHVETSVPVEVIAPTVRRCRLTTATVSLLHDGQYLVDGNWFALYEPAPHEHYGCVWDVEVKTGVKRLGTRTFGGGSFAFIQVSGYEMVRLLELPPDKTRGYSHQRTAQGATHPTALDASEGDITYGDAKTVDPDTIVTFGPNDLTYSDSPGTILPGNSVWESRHDLHWLHLVYKSRAPGSIWVTLAIGTWSWQATVARKDEDTAEDFTAPQIIAISPPAHQATDLRLTHEPPVWSEQTSVLVTSHWTPGKPPDGT